MNRFQILASTSVLALLVGQGHSGAEAAEMAGRATAAVPSIQALLDGGSPRSIAVGNAIFKDERISTGPNGHLHILFRDETNLTVGPNSDVTIDEFVFDDTTSSGQFVLSQTQGVTRLVGGLLTKTGQVRVNTPVATIGVRGGVALIRMLPGGGVQAFFVFGDEMSVDGTSGQNATLDQAGFSVVVGPDGSVGAPTPIQPGDLADATNALERPAGGGDFAAPDAVLANLQDRLSAQPLDPETGLLLDGPGGAPITLEEFEALLGADTLDEENTRQVFEDIRESFGGSDY